VKTDLQRKMERRARDRAEYYGWRDRLDKNLHDLLGYPHGAGHAFIEMQSRALADRLLYGAKGRRVVTAITASGEPSVFHDLVKAVPEGTHPAFHHLDVTFSGMGWWPADPPRPPRPHIENPWYTSAEILRVLSEEDEP
jgi:hypothetical protein